MIDVKVRAAEPEDVNAIATVFLDCWKMSYAEVLPASDISRWSVERAHRFWTEHLVGSTDQTVSVAVVDQRIAGVARWHTAEAIGDIDSLYVSPEASGRGVGRTLMEAACSQMADCGCQSARLWVFEVNESAREFYRRLGFADDGRRQRSPDYSIDEIGMEKFLPCTNRRAGEHEQ